jgi:hypothetical protein
MKYCRIMSVDRFSRRLGGSALVLSAFIGVYRRLH